VVPIDSIYAVPLAMIGAVSLLVLGILFFFAPESGLKFTKHHAEDLPTIMASRYFFFAFVVVAVVWKGTPELLAAVFFGLAAVAFLDAATYGLRGKTMWPHISAGLAALVIPIIALAGLTTS